MPTENPRTTRTTPLSVHRPATVGRSFAYSALVGLLLQSIVACDATAPVDPKDSAERVVSDPSLAVSSSGISAKSVSWNEIDVSWAAAAHVTGYQLFRSTTGVAGGYTMILMTSDATATYSNTGLTPSTQYCYEIRSYKTAGRNTNYAAFSAPICATTLASPVAAPSEVHAAPSGYSIHISWKDNSTNEDGFHIEQASTTSGPWTQISNAAANATSADAHLYLEQSVCFRVTAFNAIAPSSPSPAVCTSPLASPSSLSAKALDQQSLTLRWTDNSAFEDGYEVLRLAATGVWTAIATVPANTTTYRDASVTLDAVYKYRVRATKDGGYSELSNEVTGVIPTTVPAAPANAYAYASGSPFDFGGAYFLMAWTDESTNEEGFRIEYSSDGVTGWRLYAMPDANDTVYEEHSSQSYAPDGCYRVIAFNSLGASQPSNRACAIHENAPDALVATSVDQQNIDVTWNDAAFETSYQILRSTSIDGSWQSVGDLPANVTSFHDSGLTAGVEYCYWVSVEGMSIPYDEPQTIVCATPGSSASGIQAAGAAGMRTLLANPHAGNSRPVPGAHPPMHVPLHPVSKRTK